MTDSILELVGRLSRAGLDPMSMTLRQCLEASKLLDERNKEELLETVQVRTMTVEELELIFGELRRIE